jgi:hypothetical protein
LLDGVGESAKALIEVSKAADVNVAQVLTLQAPKSSSTCFQAEQPTPQDSTPHKPSRRAAHTSTPPPTSSPAIPMMATQFEDADLPLVGDDLVDQIAPPPFTKRC